MLEFVQSGLPFVSSSGRGIESTMLAFVQSGLPFVSSSGRGIDFTIWTFPILLTLGEVCSLIGVGLLRVVFTLKVPGLDVTPEALAESLAFVVFVLFAIAEELIEPLE